MTENPFTREQPHKFHAHLQCFLDDTPQALQGAVESLRAGTFVDEYPYLGLDEADNWCVALDELLGTVVVELQHSPELLASGNDLLKHLADLNSATDESALLRLRLFAAAGVPQDMMADYLRIAYTDTSGQADKILTEIYGGRAN